jgi:hypothetical protein
MEAELLLDGLYTHNKFKECMNPIHAERIGLALGAVRSARNTLRADMKGRQLTLFTRGKKYNRSGVNWMFNAVPQWKCDCQKPFIKKGIWTPNGKVIPRKEKKLAEPMQPEM